MNEISVDQLLVQMRSMAEKAQGQQVNANQAEGMADFSTLLKSSVDKVSEIQQQAGQLTKAFEMGDKNVNLVDVMIGLQKASLSFQAMTQVRNRLVSAYQDVMNMQL